MLRYTPNGESRYQIRIYSPKPCEAWRNGLIVAGASLMRGHVLGGPSHTRAVGSVHATVMEVRFLFLLFHMGNINKTRRRGDTFPQWTPWNVLGARCCVWRGVGDPAECGVTLAGLACPVTCELRGAGRVALFSELHLLIIKRSNSDNSNNTSSRGGGSHPSRGTRHVAGAVDSALQTLVKHHRT